MVYNKEEERQRASKVGVKDLDKIWERDELVSGELVFFATGVTSGSLLEGIKREGDTYTTKTLILTPKGKKEITNTFLQT